MCVYCTVHLHSAAAVVYLIVSCGAGEASVHDLVQEMRVGVSSWVKICCFLDFLAVALVLPQLSAYFTSAGVSKEHYAFIMSVYHFSQIIGGVVMGYMTDVVSRKQTLILSFVGSSVSYAIVGLSNNLYVLFASRVLVGLVKQTMSISTAVLSSICDDHAERAQHIGHVSAAVTLAYIIGPSIGSLLYSMNPSYPALVASALFIVNVIICSLAIPESLGRGGRSKDGGGASFISDLQFVLRSSNTVWPLFSLILVSFVEQSMSLNSMLSYFEVRYSMETKNIGFVKSLSSLYALIANFALVKPIIALCGGSEHLSMVLTLCISTVASIIESHCSSVYQYLVLPAPLLMMSANLVMTLSRSVLSYSTSPRHVGVTFAVYGVFESIVGVLAPLYGAYVLNERGYESRGWIAGGHYFVAGCLVWLLLSGREKPPDEESKSCISSSSTGKFSKKKEH